MLRYHDFNCRQYSGSVYIDSHRIYYMYIKLNLRLEHYLYSCASIVHLPYCLVRFKVSLQICNEWSHRITDHRFSRSASKEVIPALLRDVLPPLETLFVTVEGTGETEGIFTLKNALLESTKIGVLKGEILSRAA